MGRHSPAIWCSVASFVAARVHHGPSNLRCAGAPVERKGVSGRWARDASPFLPNYSAQLEHPAIMAHLKGGTLTFGGPMGTLRIGLGRGLSGDDTAC